MSGNEHNYVMRYVPMRKDIIDLANVDFSGIKKDLMNYSSDDMRALAEVCISAVEAMTAMTAMVYMKCMASWEDK
ncbi:MAG: hypothetical protein E7218_06985 [Anaerofustis stercorihominis]|nr:hypothetical protein [Anaerofustis stercorihominis]